MEGRKVGKILSDKNGKGKKSEYVKECGKIIHKKSFLIQKKKKKGKQKSQQ